MVVRDMKLILVRHGETEWNNSRKTQGTVDTELSERGLLQAERLAERLYRNYKVDFIYTSPLKRAAVTAETIGAKLGIKPVYDGRLIEICFGEWEGLLFAEIGSKYPDEFAVWASEPDKCHVPGGEPVSEVAERIDSFLSDMKEKHRDECVAVVAHAFTSKMIIAQALKLAPRTMHSIAMDNTSLSVLDIGPERAVLRLLNDTCHLEDMKV